MPAVPMLFAIGAAVCAGIGGACAAIAVAEARRRGLRRGLTGGSSMVEAGASGRFAVEGLAAKVLQYACSLERRRLDNRADDRRGEGDRDARARERLEKALREAGMAGLIGLSSLRAARWRLACIGCIVGAAAGVVLSTELAVILGAVGAAAGLSSVSRAIRAERTERIVALDRDLPEMLEVVALGLRSGLSFDRSFSLYHGHFSTAFARECATAQQRWSLGLSSREEALRDLAASYDSPLLTRVVGSAVRSLRFGTSLAEAFESSAAEARAVRKARREEQIAKAPVKMMLPTGTLILPAMLVLVLGPVLLELAQGV